jgi:hypothetical protein
VKARVDNLLLYGPAARVTRWRGRGRGAQLRTGATAVNPAYL